MSTVSKTGKAVVIHEAPKVGGIGGEIAAIALTYGYAVATRNVWDFENCGIDVINPWEAAA